MATVLKRSWKTKNGISTSWQVNCQDAFGNRILESGFQTKFEAEMRLGKILSDVQAGNNSIQNKEITFSEAAQLYLELHAEIHCKKSTVESYKGYLKNHILPYIGKMKLIDITPITIQKFQLEKLKTDLSKETINKLLILTGSIFQKMIDDEIILKNPVRKVKKLKVEHKKEIKILSIIELNVLLETAKTYFPDFYPLLFTALMTGMRQGELLGLEWSKINWVTNKITIDRNYTHGIACSPKTKYSIRKIDMSQELARVLKIWRLQCPHSKNDLVFPNSNGEYMDANNMMKRRFMPTLRRAGLDRIRFHDLRHTYVSLLLAEGIPIKYIQKQVGHSSIKVTMDIYGHIMPETAEQSVKVLDSLFSKQIVEKNIVNL